MFVIDNLSPAQKAVRQCAYPRWDHFRRRQQQVVDSGPGDPGSRRSKFSGRPPPDAVRPALSDRHVIPPKLARIRGDHWAPVGRRLSTTCWEVFVKAGWDELTFNVLGEGMLHAGWGGSRILQGVGWRWVEVGCVGLESFRISVLKRYAIVYVLTNNVSPSFWSIGPHHLIYLYNS